MQLIFPLRANLWCCCLGHTWASEQHVHWKPPHQIKHCVNNNKVFSLELTPPSVVHLVATITELYCSITSTSLTTLTWQCITLHICKVLNQNSDGLGCNIATVARKQAEQQAQPARTCQHHAPQDRCAGCWGALETCKLSTKPCRRPLTMNKTCTSTQQLLGKTKRMTGLQALHTIC